MADHTVTVDYDQDPFAGDQTMTCNAPPLSQCHAVFDCECESWSEIGIVDGNPRHTSWGDEVHVGRFNPKECNLRDWFEGTDECLAGSFTAPVDAEWEGDFYTFRLTPPTEGGAS